MGVGCLVLLGVFVLWRIHLYREINRRFARIRAAGLPASSAELNAWRGSVADTENGALVMTQAFALVHTFPDGRSNEVTEPMLLNRTNRWSSATRGLVRAYAQTNAQALAKAGAALLLPRFRYPVDYSCGPDGQMPHLGPLKELARIAALQTALDAEEGRADQWPEHVRFLLQIASTLDGEPTLISHLAQHGIIRTAVKAVERSLNRVSTGDGDCARLQAAFTHASETNLLPYALIGERALLIPVFRLSSKETEATGQGGEQEGKPRQPQRYSGKPALVLWLPGFFERDLNFFLETMETSISLAGLPPPRNLALTNYLATVGATADKRHYLLSGLLLPALSRVAVREATTQARIELARTAMAIERFRHRRGRRPDTLNALVPQFLPAVPSDPFDGAPLRYRLLDRGYLIYSVGPDGHDDAGREMPERKRLSDETSYDITFIVER